MVTDDVRRGQVDQVPGVEPDVPAQVEVEKLRATGFRRRLGCGLLAHDAQGAGPHLVKAVTGEDIDEIVGVAIEDDVIESTVAGRLEQARRQLINL